MEPKQRRQDEELDGPDNQHGLATDPKSMDSMDSDLVRPHKQAYPAQ